MSEYTLDTSDVISNEIVKIDTAINNGDKHLNNRYVLGRQLGLGGLCIVYSAKDNYSEYYGDHRNLAIKLPLEQLSKKSDIDAFMYAEYAHLSQLSHLNIIKAIDFGIDANLNLPYIVLEHLGGRLLHEIPLSELDGKRKKDLTRRLFDTIRYLHSMDIVHADISPTNIMCLENGTIKLFDFGISINLNKKQLFELDYKTIKAYNPRYAAPEIIEGAFPDKKSDIFSLAALLYELYTGTLPYINNSLDLYIKPVSFYTLRNVPMRLHRWFQRALSPDLSIRINYIPLY